MIRSSFLALALVAVSTPALACECDDPARTTEAERQRQAAWIVSSGASIAEVELVRTAEGDRYRTVRHLFGPPQVDYLARDPVGPFTSCDYAIPAGERAIMVFVPPRRFGKEEPAAPCGRSPAHGRGELVPAGMCTQFFIQALDNLDRIRRAAAQ